MLSGGEGPTRNRAPYRVLSGAKRLGVLVAIAAVCPLACVAGTAARTGAGGSAAQLLGQPAAPIDWATQMLGTPPRSVTVTRPYPGSDSLEQDRSPDPSPTDFATSHCRQADEYSTGSQGSSDDSSLAGDIIVLHGVPSWLDPSRPYPRARDTAWTAAGTSPSGVRTYHGTRGSHDEPVQLYVLPSSTWIVATGAAGQRVGWALTSSATEPAALDAIPGAYSQESFPVDGAELARSGKCWVRDCTRVVAAGLVLFPPSGKSTTRGAFFVFPDEGTARAAASDAQRLLADPATRERLVGPMNVGERFLGVQGAGRVVVFLTESGG
jgi:hypothetical protein